MTAPALLCVCIKPAWRTEVPLRLDAAGRGPRPAEALVAADPAALSALALALALRAAEPGVRVLALAVGPPAAEAVLREALAAGADEALRVWGADWPAAAPPVDAGDGVTRAHAAAAAQALRSRAPALVLAGERSADTGHEAFGAALAGELGAAFAHRCSELRRAGAGWQALVRLERGYGQPVALPEPAVATVSARLPRPAEASLPAWLAARAAAIPLFAAEGPPPQAGPGALRVPLPRTKRLPVPGAGLSAEERIRALVELPAQGGGTVLADASPEAQAEAVLALLRERGYL
jgi:electron transfer flavoprotein beta subunit